MRRIALVTLASSVLLVAHSGAAQELPPPITLANFTFDRATATLVGTYFEGVTPVTVTVTVTESTVFEATLPPEADVPPNPVFPPNPVAPSSAALGAVFTAWNALALHFPPNPVVPPSPVSPRNPFSALLFALANHGAGAEVVIDGSTLVSFKPAPGIVTDM